MSIKSKKETELGFASHLPPDSRVDVCDLRGLLYVHGYTCRNSKVHEELESGRFGSMRCARLQLVSAIHSYVCNKLDEGYSELTMKANIGILKVFYKYHDEKGIDLTFNNVAKQYAEWTKNEVRRIETKQISGDTAYSTTSKLGGLLSGALEIPTGILKNAVDYRYKKKGVHGAGVDKTNPNESFIFGAALLDVISSLSFEACCGPLPLNISFADGKSIELGAVEPITKKSTDARPNNHTGRDRKAKQNRMSGDITTRSSFFNLRIHAEFNFFIAQTGMNVSTAYALPMADFRYATLDDSYEVYAYKNRRAGNVEFKIYKAYRPYFDRYLEFIRKAFPAGVKNLFPFVNRNHKEGKKKIYTQERIIKFFKAVGKKTYPLSQLRGARINWLLRTTDDQSLIANDAQHSVQTMHRIYTKPNFHIASREFGQFFRQSKIERDAVLVGGCETVTPIKVANMQVGPEPDCINPAGCAFCEHYRGKISFDYIWTIKTYLKLKTYELARMPIGQNINDSPQQALIDQLMGIIDIFSQQGPECRQWSAEADMRMAEGDYHPAFSALMEIMI